MDGAITGEPGFLIERCKSHAMTSSNIFEMRHFLRDNDIVKWKIRSRGLVWHATRILLKGESLNLMFKS